jgi:hypothetical protein
MAAENAYAMATENEYGIATENEQGLSVHSLPKQARKRAKERWPVPKESLERRDQEMSEFVSVVAGVISPSIIIN